jgi:tRNA threonylcarbamoyl adenosine modification protein YeaZ
MKILALDTSTPVLSVALIEDQVVLSERSAGEITGAQLHGEALASLVQEILQEHSIDKVAVGLGPGPYTGLRTGIALAQAVAFARQVPIVGISSLLALAHGFWRRGGESGFAVLDAKRKEIAWQEFDASRMLNTPTLTKIDDIHILIGKTIVGPAFLTQPTNDLVVHEDFPPSAVDIALLCAQGFGESISPLYLRAPDVTPKDSHA